MALPASSSSDQLSPFVLKDIKGLEETAQREEEKAVKGAYGYVFKVNVDGVECIAKKLHSAFLNHFRVSLQERQGITSKFRNECIILSKLKHPNIVQFVGVHYGRRNSDLTLIMESVRCDMDDFLSQHPNVPLSLKLSILLDVSYGLVYLHECNPPIIHRDLTARNILITDKCQAKIADLGMAKIVDLQMQLAQSHTQTPGQMYYMPPEALKQNAECTPKLDIFSFGHLALFAVLQKFPEVLNFYDISQIPAMQLEGTMERARRAKSLKVVGSDHCLYPIITECLYDSPNKRPTTRQLNTKLFHLAMKNPNSLVNLLPYTGSTITAEEEKVIKQICPSAVANTLTAEEVKLMLGSQRPKSCPSCSMSAPSSYPVSRTDLNPPAEPSCSNDAVEPQIPADNTVTSEINTEPELTTNFNSPSQQRSRSMAFSNPVSDSDQNPAPNIVQSSASTSVPSIVPSSGPSSMPTSIPSSAIFAQSSVPGSVPSSIPSTATCSVPESVSDSVQSSVPSSVPSSESVPNAVPCSILSSIPISMPSFFPSIVPGSMPSFVPISVPSSAPSTVSSSEPVPSAVPGSMPSSVPSSVPSAVPGSMSSSIPISVPSSAPSSIPSSVSSSVPRPVPSSVPGSMPSSVPISVPSSIPNSEPLPSTVPGFIPNSVPISVPSSVLSSEHSVSGSTPSCLPISVPSSASSFLPISEPKPVPSSMPSSGPSSDPISVPSSVSGLVPSSVPSFSDQPQQNFHGMAARSTTQKDEKIGNREPEPSTQVDSQPRLRSSLSMTIPHRPLSFLDSNPNPNVMPGSMPSSVPSFSGDAVQPQQYLAKMATPSTPLNDDKVVYKEPESTIEVDSEVQRHSYRSKVQRHSYRSKLILSHSAYLDSNPKPVQSSVPSFSNDEQHPMPTFPTKLEDDSKAMRVVDKEDESPTKLYSQPQLRSPQPKSTNPHPVSYPSHDPAMPSSSEDGVIPQQPPMVAKLEEDKGIREVKERESVSQSQQQLTRSMPYSSCPVSASSVPKFYESQQYFAKMATHPTTLKGDNKKVNEPVPTTAQLQLSTSCSIPSRPVSYHDSNPNPLLSPTDEGAPKTRDRAATLPRNTSRPKPIVAPKPSKKSPSGGGSVRSKVAFLEQNLGGRLPVNTRPPGYQNANAPANYIEKAKVLCNYTKQYDDELSISAGSIVYVTKKEVDRGWDEGVCDGKTGLIPASHLSVLEKGNTSEPSSPVGSIPAQPDCHAHDEHINKVETTTEGNGNKEETWQLGQWFSKWTTKLREL